MRVGLLLFTTSLIVPNPGLIKFRYGASIVATCGHRSSTKTDAECDKLATLVGRTKLTILATVDVRATTVVSLSH